MPSVVQLRDDYDTAELRKLAKRSRDPRQIRRLLALAAVYDGMSRAEAAKVGDMDRQTLRDWAHRFNEDGPDGLTNRPGAGRPQRLTDDQMQTLAAIVETGPDPAVDGVVRWRRSSSPPLTSSTAAARADFLARTVEITCAGRAPLGMLSDRESRKRRSCQRSADAEAGRLSCHRAWAQPLRTESKSRDLALARLSRQCAGSHLDWAKSAAGRILGAAGEILGRRAEPACYTGVKQSTAPSRDSERYSFLAGVRMRRSDNRVLGAPTTLTTADVKCVSSGPSAPRALKRTGQGSGLVRNCIGTSAPI